MNALNVVGCPDGSSPCKRSCWSDPADDVPRGLPLPASELRGGFHVGDERLAVGEHPFGVSPKLTLESSGGALRECAQEKRVGFVPPPATALDPEHAAGEGRPATSVPPTTRHRPDAKRETCPTSLTRSAIEPSLHLVKVDRIPDPRVSGVDAARHESPTL